jgi:HK97 family phage portal protein
VGIFLGSEKRSNPFENPGRPLSDPSLLSMLGGVPTASGTIVNEQTSLQTVAVFRAVSLLSGLVAGLPLKAYRYKDKSEVIPPALKESRYGLTRFETWETVMVHLLLWGNAYLRKERNGFGAITGLTPVFPGRVQVKMVMQDDGHPDGKIFEIRNPQGVPAPFTSFEILHIPGLGYDGIQGLSPISVARQSLGIYTAAEQTAARLFGNGTLMSGILSTDQSLDQVQADALKQRWRDKMAGIGHSHDIAVLDSGTTFTPISIPPDDAQFLESRRWQTVEIARWFGIPPHLLGDVEKSTSWGTGIEQQNIGFVAYTLRPWLNRIEQRVTREVVEPATQYAEFLIDGLLRGDTAERYAAYSTGIQWGFITRNEARVKENLVPLDGLDEPLTPLNMSKGDEETPLAPGSTSAPTPSPDPAVA